MRGVTGPVFGAAEQPAPTNGVANNMLVKFRRSIIPCSRGVRGAKSFAASLGVVTLARAKAAPGFNFTSAHICMAGYRCAVGRVIE